MLFRSSYEPYACAPLCLRSQQDHPARPRPTLRLVPEFVAAQLEAAAPVAAAGRPPLRSCTVPTTDCKVVVAARALWRGLQEAQICSTFTRYSQASYCGCCAPRRRPRCRPQFDCLEPSQDRTSAATTPASMAVRRHAGNCRLLRNWFLSRRRAASYRSVPPSGLGTRSASARTRRHLRPDSG